jgi:Spy/CpxP family protein refolding chaperone
VSIYGTLTDRTPSWHNPRILFLLLVVFLGGLGCGLFAGHVIESRRLARAVAPWHAGGRERAMAHLKQDLNLTPDQARQIEALLEDLAMYYDNLQGQMDDFRADGKERIRKVLTPEQQKKFEKLLAEMGPRIR